MSDQQDNATGTNGTFEEVAPPDGDTADLEFEASPPEHDEDDVWIEPAPAPSMGEQPEDPKVDEDLAPSEEAPPKEATPKEAPPKEATEERPRKGACQIIAFASGKGGVGKSLLATSVGIYLAQLGRDVVLVDASLGCGNIHTLVGVDKAEATLQSFFRRDIKQLSDAIIETPFPKLGLLSGIDDGITAANPRPAQKGRLLSQLRSLPTDYVVVDTSSGTGFNTLDIFLASDVHIVVTEPEPTAIESSMRLMKSAFLRRLRTLDGFDTLVAKAQEGAYRGLPTPRQLLRQAQADRPELVDEICKAMNTFRPLLLINKTRTRADLEIGPALTIVCRRHLGLPVEYIGYVEHEDLAWVSVRKRKPLLVQFTEAKVCKDIERVARRIAGRDNLDRTLSSNKTVPLEDQSHYEILGLHPGAPEAEVRSAERRLRGIYDAESQAIYGVVPPDEVASVRERVEAAYATLVDPEKSQTYIREIFPDWQAPEEEEMATKQSPETPDVREGLLEREDVTPLPLPTMPEIHADTPFDGALLRAVRAARGLELMDIAEQTKISISHLQAIEDEIFPNPPAAVYLKGFLRAVARQLKLDPEQVVQTYMERFETFQREAKGR
ncbi:MAG: helix-turn-helix domain-containing protein [Deltaproteobacteria bacterium]|nr:helix-turn-helix domain-containing protein [Deltaproteobacteria bacterium]